MVNLLPTRAEVFVHLNVRTINPSFCAVAFLFHSHLHTSDVSLLNLIGATSTKRGLGVKALLDTREYEPGQKITHDEMHKLRVQPHKFHGDWNYTVQPHRAG
jgi:hypothetical protein